MAAVGFEFDWQPTDAPGVQDPSEWATWATLMVRVASGSGEPEIPTRLFDRNAKTERDFVWGTILPLAEWFVDAWPHLFGSRRSVPPASDVAKRYDWDRMHKWRYCGGGSALPDMTLSPEAGGAIRLSWTRDRDDEATRYERVLFSTDGNCLLNVDYVRRSIRAFLEGVGARLRQCAAEAPRTVEFLEEWRAASDPKHPLHRPKVLAALLGTVWWELTDEESASLCRIAGESLSPPEEAILEAATLESLAVRRKEAAEAWRRCENRPSAPKSWLELWDKVGGRDGTGRDGTPPWRRGWAGADRLRRALSIADDAPWRNRGNILDDLDILDIRSEAPPGELGSLLAWKGDRLPVRLLPTRSSARSAPAKSFTLLRDSYEVFFGRSPREDNASLLSRYVAGSRSVADAFAAELLAPIEWVRRKAVDCNAIGWEDVEEWAREVDAPVFCVKHQIENHGLARVDEEELGGAVHGGAGA